MPAEVVAEPLSPEEKIAALEKRIATLEAELAQAKADAITDKLTGLPNRRFIEEALEVEFARIQRGTEGVAIVLIDIDHFKKVNDTYGHLQGDFVLQQFADMMREVTRDTDIIGRWGGEEFLVIIPLPNEATTEEVQEILDRYRAETKKISRCPSDQDFAPLTISIGCTIVNAGSQLTKEEAVSRADASLYWSKTTGRDRSTIH